MTKLDITDLKLNDNELKRRLLGDYTPETLNKCESALAEILNIAEASYCFKEVPVSMNGQGLDLGFGSFESSDLRKFLSSAEKAYLVAATLGISVDRLLNKKAAVSTAEHFICDAVASALIEAVCDRVQALLPTESTSRFSPGYGDLDVRLQRPLLKFLKADGISLTDSGLMIPTKSVTFIARKAK